MINSIKGKKKLKQTTAYYILLYADHGTCWQRVFGLLSAFCFLPPWLPGSCCGAGAGMSAHGCLTAWLAGGADTKLKPIHTLCLETRCIDIIMLISGVMPLPLFPSLPAAALLL